MSILLVNVGNTNTTLAGWDGRRLSVLVRKPGGFSRRDLPSCLTRLCRAGEYSDAVLCSVVPPATLCWRRALRRHFRREPLVVGPRLRLGFRFDYRRQATVGADRLADVCAVATGQGGPAVVVDTGTATTFNVLTADGRFVGGAIAPGVAAFADYLVTRTALLPRINPLRGRSPRIGRSTKGALRLGIEAGYRGMLSEIVSELRPLAGPRARVYLTGGFARRTSLRKGIRPTVDPLLTLRGMAAAYGLNRTAAKRRKGRSDP
jgi:type III pantothenate kinase